MKCDLGGSIQIVSIIASVLNIVSALWLFIVSCVYPDRNGILDGLIILVLSLLVFFPDVYMFSFYKYFSFVILDWGKAIIYFLIACRFFHLGYFDIFYFTWIFDYIMAIFFIVITFVKYKHYDLLFQKKSEVNIKVSSEELMYKTNE